ncbi:hypothetical protein E3U23_08730 [Erythrobacter litoralis]|uniref:hypothetical protein n=1 Tax=Erythrobacter litoralis TaxID=39960 RepID=UPI0024356343|nr:hypothetical protein [Erythrobacter litoralis]MDG6079277.1 hypothetical protein [Erythrobacter litoralis]
MNASYVLALLMQTIEPSMEDVGQCDVPIPTDIVPISIDYEPFDFVPASGSSSIVLRSPADNEGEFEIALVAENTPNDFALTFEASSNEAAVTRVSDSAFLVRSKADSVFSLDITSRVSIHQPPAPGDYGATYRIDVRDTLSNVECLGRASLPIAIRVPPRAQLNIAGADSPFSDGPDLYTVSFDTMETGAERTVFIQLRSNSDAVLEFESENAGSMKSTTGHSVSYTASLNGSILDLSSLYSMSVPSAPTARGTNQPLTIRLDDVSEAPAGKYQDRVTITVSAF